MGNLKLELEEIKEIQKIKKEFVEKLNKNVGFEKYVNATYFGKCLDKDRVDGQLLELYKQLFMVQDVYGNIQIIASDGEKYGVVVDEQYRPNEANERNDKIKYQMDELIEDKEKRYIVNASLDKLDKIEQDIKKRVENQNEKVGDVQYIGTNKVLCDKKDLSIEQQVGRNTVVENSQSLGKILNLPSEIETLAVVSTTSINSKTQENTTAKHSIVGITKNGQVVDLSNLIEQDIEEGITGDEKSMQIKADSSVEENKSVVSHFKIKNNGMNLSVGIDDLGQREVYIGRKTKDGNEQVLVEVETHQTDVPNKQQQNINRTGKGTDHTDEMKDEAKIHEKHTHEQSLENVDGDPTTATQCEPLPDIKQIYENLEYYKENFKNFTNPDLKRDIQIAVLYDKQNVKEDIEQFKKHCMDKEQQQKQERSR